MPQRIISNISQGNRHEGSSPATKNADIQRRPAPIHVHPDILFAPKDRLTYDDPDEERRIFAQQPFPGSSLPFSYLIPSRTAQLKPPTLRLGWRLGPYKVMELVRRYFPDTIERCQGPLNAGMFDSDGNQLESPDEAWEEENDNIFETIMGVELIIALRTLLSIKKDKMVRVLPLYDSELKGEFTLTIGTNYLGIPSREAIAKLEEMVVSVAPDARLYGTLIPTSGNGIGSL
ncbi:hypothetical protein C8Q74DRAFT_1362356 [Fomes fomentarius]|nr:hypothetical protein C8Q74DRAFT_1362356 [Fomes fomentarius]